MITKAEAFNLLAKCIDDQLIADIAFDEDTSKQTIASVLMYIQGYCDALKDVVKKDGDSDKVSRMTPNETPVLYGTWVQTDEDTWECCRLDGDHDERK